MPLNRLPNDLTFCCRGARQMFLIFLQMLCFIFGICIPLEWHRRSQRSKEAWEPYGLFFFSSSRASKLTIATSEERTDKH